MTEVYRLLTANLESKFYSTHVPRQSINYRGDNLELTESDYDEILSLLPEYWHTDKDRLLRFVAFSDKSFYCERVKEVFNYTNRDTETKVYKFDAATAEQATEIFNVFLDFYSRKKIERIDNLYNSIIDKIKDLSYIEYNLLSTREKILKDTDYFMLPDYPLSDEKREEWKTYRQEWRDITQQDAWKTRNYSEIIIPISPDPSSELCVLMNEVRYSISNTNFSPEIVNSLVEKYDDNPPVEIIKKFAEIQIKSEIMRSLYNIKLPFVDLDVSSIKSPIGIASEISNEMLVDEVLIGNENPENWWVNGLERLDEKIQIINEQLKKYDIDFTINDILNDLVNQNKRSEIEYEAEQLIQQIQNEDGAI